MRYISLLKQAPDPRWLAKAAEATAELEGEPDPAKRAELINKNARIWKGLKKWLLELSDQKCWFSEAKDCFQDWDVEHFRPKTSARNLDGVVRDGYWWLAFDWKNLRICGRVGNNKKGTFFPLGSAHIADAKNRDIEEEVPYLLDPTVEADCSLLSFDRLGEAIPAQGLDDWSRKRVLVSVERYGLNYEPLALQRLTVWKTCEAMLNEIQNLMAAQAKAPGAAKQALIREKMDQLSSYTKRSQGCSSAAIAFLQKSGVEWANRLISEAA